MPSSLHPQRGAELPNFPLVPVTGAVLAEVESASRNLAVRDNTEAPCSNPRPRKKMSAGTSQQMPVSTEISPEPAPSPRIYPEKGGGKTDLSNPDWQKLPGTEIEFFHALMEFSKGKVD